MYNNRRVGSTYEKKAIDYLKQNHYTHLQANYRCKIGEIDIIAQDGKYLVFIEVKYRKNNKKGYPREAVHYYKQKTIIKVAQYYLMEKKLMDKVSVRFDVVEILDQDIQLIKNAFY
ncbi:putative endonuclease [Natranaerovirga hydrolytica]|uniref:UPF0102 protein EDC19_0717 n=1 Tax=Natranaerovirga hydrolytica TaxID=680378 RepID=A0A4R1MYD5_9FIRM|nr:YraN family protein [Natranaerovirga hydrolytica]TCK98297.1 putative endonuclease [Natranaerovirga hydrolytica]